VRLFSIYLFRTVLAALGCAVGLRFGYGPPTVYDHGHELLWSYFVVCSILSGCCLLGWGFTFRLGRSVRWIAAAFIGMALSYGLVLISEATNQVVGMPWHYFYKDDSVLVFQVAAPSLAAFFAATLLWLPERR